LGLSTHEISGLGFRPQGLGFSSHEGLGLKVWGFSTHNISEPDDSFLDNPLGGNSNGSEHSDSRVVATQREDSLEGGDGESTQKLQTSSSDETRSLRHKFSATSDETRLLPGDHMTRSAQSLAPATGTMSAFSSRFNVDEMIAEILIFIVI
jgi:hypothetical protein